MNRGIVHYRSPRARVAVAYSTKDRTELTRTTVEPLLDHPDIDLYWFDGSTHQPGRDLPLSMCPGRPAACELHQGVVGGADAAIIYMMRTLRARSYDFVILIENDVLVSEGWYEALLASMEAAKRAGFRVGGASVRVYANRTLSFNDEYCLLSNSGAGFICLTPEAIDIVLENHRTISGLEFVRLFHLLTGIDFSESVEWSLQSGLSADWIFDLLLYLHGYVVSAPPVSFAANIDQLSSALKPVTKPGDHLAALKSLITRPDQIRKIEYPFFRFQKSLFSDRLLIPSHHLLISINSNAAALPVRAEGRWWRQWTQTLGPFSVLGTGQLRVDTYGLTIGLVVRPYEARTTVRLSCADGSSSSTPEIHNTGGFVEVPLPQSIFQTQGAILEVSGAPIYLVGVTVDAVMLPYYANKHQTLDHLTVDLPTGFDPGTYLRLNPDVQAARMDPTHHYLRFGFAEGRKWMD